MKKISSYVLFILFVVGGALGYLWYQDGFTKATPFEIGLNFGTEIPEPYFPISFFGKYSPTQQTDFPDSAIALLKKKIVFEPGLEGQWSNQPLTLMYQPLQIGDGWTIGQELEIKLKEPVEFVAGTPAAKKIIHPFVLKLKIPGPELKVVVATVDHVFGKGTMITYDLSTNMPFDPILGLPVLSPNEEVLPLKVTALGKRNFAFTLSEPPAEPQLSVTVRGDGFLLKGPRQETYTVPLPQLEASVKEKAIEVAVLNVNKRLTIYEDVVSDLESVTASPKENSFEYLQKKILEWDASQTRLKGYKFVYRTTEQMRGLENVEEVTHIYHMKVAALESEIQGAMKDGSSTGDIRNLRSMGALLRYLSDSAANPELSVGMLFNLHTGVLRSAHVLNKEGQHTGFQIIEVTPNP